MEQMSSSSKVTGTKITFSTVEYFDPFGVYRLLSPSLIKRLPLRNLHWVSHAGPLRSIDTLFIDLIQSHENSATTDSIPASLASHRSAKSEESTGTSDEGSRIFLSGQVLERPHSQSSPMRVHLKERRHQIPGLRQTPYLKIFILRCDDVETYRALGRPHIKQWIKKNTPATQVTTRINAQENYDAFEWLIIHVTIPNTAVANHPRTSGKNSEGSSGITKEKSGSRWRGGGSSTVLEKLRADFNGTSKSSVDRIAQIRLTIDDVPPEMVPRLIPSITKPYVETPQENENAWQDLISKLKSLILTAFDMRVSQYEDDIREKDAQRSLPGWNFCTFFVLKEGLALGYESVGLIEDSLIEYDELAVGLDTIIREQAANKKIDHASSFLPYTDDLKRQAEAAIASISKDMGLSNFVNTGASLDLQSDIFSNQAYEIPLNPSKKRYRELILGNNISVFDFRCYLFARQLNLLLRLANASSSKEELFSKVQEQIESNPKSNAAKRISTRNWDNSENLTMLSKICRRAMEFIPSIARIMRTDLWTSHHRHRSRDSIENETSMTRMNQIMSQVTENIVSSFIFSTTQQILAHTSTKYLQIPPSTLAHLPSLDRRDSMSSVSEQKLTTHPTRSSSLTSRSQARQQKDTNFSPRIRRASLPDDGSASPAFLKMGLEELAAHRAELYLFSRSVLQRYGAQCGWSVGWQEMAKSQTNSVGELEDIDLNQDTTKRSSARSDQNYVPPSRHGIASRLLRTGLSNKDDFYLLYETLSDKALRHYTVANSFHSIQSCVADLAILKYYMKDFTASASYLKRMIVFYDEAGWKNIELSMLIIYAKCLQHLERREEYVQIVIKLLSKTAFAENERLKLKSLVYLKNKGFFEDFVLVKEKYLPRLFDITRTLPSPTYIPLNKFFGSLDVDETVIYHQDSDGFELLIRCLYLLDDELPFEKAKVRINSTNSKLKRDIWLENEDSFIFKKGINEIYVGCNTNIPDSYLVTCVILSGNNVIYTYDRNDAGTKSNSKSNSFLRCPKLLIYQRPGVFDMRLNPSKYIQLGAARSLELELSSGWNDVKNGRIRIRAATAGLRLQTSDANVVYGSVDILQNQEVGIVCFGAMSPQSYAIIAIPFSLEQDITEISVKLDLTYTTENGTFIFAVAPSISISYPLGVNVQDYFKHEFLFSRFTISSASSGPLRLLDCELNASEVFEAHGGPGINTPLVIYPQQPATVLYKIRRTKSNFNACETRKNEKALLLVLKFACLEEEIIATITSDIEDLLNDGSLESYTRLVVDNVVQEIRRNLSPQFFERVSLSNEIPISFLKSISWKERFLGLGRCSDGEVSILILRFLGEWLERRSTIPLITASNNDDYFPQSRSILIPVDIPSITVVHTVDLQLLETPTPYSGAARVAVNQPITVSLSIKWTRIWDTDAALELTDTKKINPEKEDSYKFSYEIFSPSEAWIIGGRRKGHFKVPKVIESSENSISSYCTDGLTFPVILIPLRQGLLPYPTVEIKAIVPVSQPSSLNLPLQNSARASTMSSKNFQTHNNLPSQEPIVSCEMDYKNAVEFIHVVSDTQKITISLDS
ncbi:putative tmem1 family protein [Erysiphe neolycopersici]|uniref:Putative tmem1 family protein n=1 Tax=Erysiphe neolycopersici TaxID=212602 RepID=A0A420HXZ3_9PEZI|nr:putative tmem1 family protein [Erysiphe neolycopersici]